MSSYVDRLIEDHLRKYGMINKAIDDDLDNVVNVGLIPDLTWEKLPFFGVRQSILKEFSDPKLLICTTNMNLVATTDIVEHTAGNVSSTSKELTIVGGTSSATGYSWIYWDLPESAEKCYLQTSWLSVDIPYVLLHICNASSSTLRNPPDYYELQLRVTLAATDFRLIKDIAATITALAEESVDLNYDTWYKIEMYYDTVNDKLQCWRDNILKFDITDGDIATIESVRFIVYDSSTSVAQTGKYKGPVVIIYE